MSSFSRATRSSKRGNCSNKSSTLQPGNGVVITPAVKKLLSEDGWNMKSSGTKKQEIHYTPEKVQRVTDVEESSNTPPKEILAEQVEDSNEYFRFIGEVQGVKDLFQESAICRHCRKGHLELEFTT